MFWMLSVITLLLFRSGDHLCSRVYLYFQFITEYGEVFIVIYWKKIYHVILLIIEVKGAITYLGIIIIIDIRKIVFMLCICFIF